MILCRKCGHENGDDASFCAECNAYLEWSGQRVPTSAPGATIPGGRPAVPAPVPAPTPATMPAPPPGLPAAAVAGPPSQPVAAQPPARPPEAAPDTPPPRRPAPAPDSQPRSRQPTADQPPSRSRPVPKPATEEPAVKAGDRICPGCGAGNDPARRFCRRCGASLEQAVVAVPVRVPWYRRMFRRSAPERYEAGERPRSMAERGRPGRPILGYVVGFGLLALILGAIGGYLAVPDVRRQVDGTIADLQRRFLPTLADVTPTGGATTEAVLDGNLVTWWEGDGEQPGLTLRFNPAVDLGAIGVTSGANGDEFPSFRRPSSIRLTPEDGEPVTLELADTRDFQSFRIDLRDVGRLRVQVLEARGPREAPVAIRELEFQETR